MDTKKLRQKILDLAIRGKLVPQDPNDEPASVLLERIRAEKERLIKEGKIKRSKKSSKSSDTPHYENDVPFKVPDSWEWTTIGEIFQHNTGKALNMSDSKEGTLKPYLTTSNVYWNSFDFTEVKQMHFKDAELDKCTVTKGDLLVCEGGDIGRAAIWNYDYNICIQNHIHRLRASRDVCQLLYLYILMLYKWTDQIQGQGIGLQGLSSGLLDKLEVPLPPFEEQNRIVTAIEQWFKTIDNLDIDNNELKTVIQHTKTKILDLAIHGKLVPQDPNDEPAIELLKRINPKFEPCDKEHDTNQLPNGWTKAVLNDVCQIIMGSSPNGEDINSIKEGVEFHQGKLNFTDLYVNPSDTYTTTITKLVPEDSVLLCVRAPVGIVNITPRQVCIGRGLCSLSPKGEMNLMFLFYALQTIQSHFEENATGTTFKAIGGDIVRQSKLSVPPINEQGRIVARIEEILAVLSEIKESLEA